MGLLGEVSRETNCAGLTDSKLGGVLSAMRRFGLFPAADPSACSWARCISIFEVELRSYVGSDDKTSNCRDCGLQATVTLLVTPATAQGCSGLWCGSQLVQPHGGCATA